MAKRDFNGDEQASDGWLLNIFGDLLDKESLVDEVVGDVAGDLDILSEQHQQQQQPTSASHPSEVFGEHVEAQMQTEPSSETPNDNTDQVLCPDKDQIDASELIAQELHRMSIGERQIIFEDVNGLTSLNEETPTFLSAKLDDLQIELNMINEKPAYNAALKQNSSYVEDDGLRLKFLRCVDYNPSVAATRMVGFFELKFELFGLDLLTEEITMYDLTSEAQGILASGKVQKLPIRDSAGRALMVWMKIDASIFTTNAPAQFFFYFTMVLLEDEATQMSGMVGVHAKHGAMKSFSLEQRKHRHKSASITATVPLKCQGFHFLVEDDPELRQIANVLKLSFSKELRHRFLTHFGSFRSCKENLVSYGIPVSMFPVTDDGEIKMETHRKWLEKRKIKEALIVDRRPKSSIQKDMALKDTTLQSSSPKTGDADNVDIIAKSLLVEESTPIIITPTDKDVLLGRGRLSQAHSGNMYLKKLIADWYDRYNIAQRMVKTAVAEDLVHLINDRGGRFLKKTDDGVWSEVELSEARNKVSHGFRKKREMDAAKSTPTNKSSTRMVDGSKRIKVQEGGD